MLQKDDYLKQQIVQKDQEEVTGDCLFHKGRFDWSNSDFMFVSHKIVPKHDFGDRNNTTDSMKK